MNLNELRNAIIKQYTPMWSINDKAHRAEHFAEVEECATVINERLNLGIDPKLIMFAAYFHDLFAWSRHNHHRLSSEYIHSTDHSLIVDNLNNRERLLVHTACLQHRASYRGSFSCPLAELINSADRGLPSDDITHFIERAIQFTKNKNPKSSFDEICNDVVKHLKEKFGTGGYARYPDLYVKAFGETLLSRKSAFDNLTFDDVKKVYGDLFCKLFQSERLELLEKITSKDRGVIDRDYFNTWTSLSTEKEIEEPNPVIDKYLKGWPYDE